MRAKKQQMNIVNFLKEKMEFKDGVIYFGKKVYLKNELIPIFKKLGLSKNNAEKFVGENMILKYTAKSFNKKMYEGFVETLVSKIKHDNYLLKNRFEVAYSMGFDNGCRYCYVPPMMKRFRKDYDHSAVSVSHKLNKGEINEDLHRKFCKCKKV